MQLESLPNIFDWYFFLVGDYRNHSLINNVFKDDFTIIAERLGGNAAIISHPTFFLFNTDLSILSLIWPNFDVFLISMQIYVKGIAQINIHGDDHKEVLEVANEMLNKSYTLFYQFHHKFQSE